jgi:hypothetical protein
MYSADIGDSLSFVVTQVDGRIGFRDTVYTVNRCAPCIWKPKEDYPAANRGHEGNETSICGR